VRILVTMQAIETSDSWARSGTRCVLLLHQLPTGTWHYDWLLDPGESLPLIAFRTDVYIPDAASFDAVRIDPHRRLYLDYEGPISGNRGEVRRVASGRCSVQLDALQRFTVDVWFEDLAESAFRYDGQPIQSLAHHAASEHEGAGADDVNVTACHTMYRFFSRKLG
jgi:hypothetical protein